MHHVCLTKHVGHLFETACFIHLLLLELYFPMLSMADFSLVFLRVQKAEAIFLVPEWRDKFESGIGLRSTRHRVAQCPWYLCLGRLWSRHKVRLLSIPAYKVHTPKAHCIVADWRGKVDFGIGLSYRPSGYIGWRACTTTLCHSRLYPPVRDNESG